MTRKVKLILAAALVVAIGTVTAGLAIAGGAIGTDDDKPLVGAALEQATKAALAETGGGTVTEAEVGDDGAAYDVEVRLADGTQVEVQLNGSFEVIGREVDDDGAVDDGAGDDAGGDDG